MKPRKMSYPVTECGNLPLAHIEMLSGSISHVGPLGFKYT